MPRSYRFLMIGAAVAASFAVNRAVADQPAMHEALDDLSDARTIW